MTPLWPRERERANEKIPIIKQTEGRDSGLCNQSFHFETDTIDMFWEVNTLLPPSVCLSRPALSLYSWALLLSITLSSWSLSLSYSLAISLVLCFSHYLLSCRYLALFLSLSHLLSFGVSLWVSEGLIARHSETPFSQYIKLSSSHFSLFYSIRSGSNTEGKRELWKDRYSHELVCPCVFSSCVSIYQWSSVIE